MEAAEPSEDEASDLDADIDQEDDESSTGEEDWFEHASEDDLNEIEGAHAFVAELASHAAKAIEEPEEPRPPSILLQNC